MKGMHKAEKDFSLREGKCRYITSMREGGVMRSRKVRSMLMLLFLRRIGAAGDAAASGGLGVDRVVEFDFGRLGNKLVN